MNRSTAAPKLRARTDYAVTCSAGYFHRIPVGLGRYFSGVAANDNRRVGIGMTPVYWLLVLAVIIAVISFA